MTYVIAFADLALTDLEQVGGKNASLGEMIQNLAKMGVKVPDGFATTADAFREYVQHNQIGDFIQNTLRQLNVDDIRALNAAGEAIRRAVKQGEFPEAMVTAIQQAYIKLNPDEKYQVAVRSSATSEDLPEASFAGQQETFLNVTGIEDVLQAIKDVFASLYTDRAIAYRVHQNFDHDAVAISAGVQRMVRSDLGSSGVAFTLDTESGFNEVIFITASYGLGEAVVSGAVNPDEFYVYKPSLAAGQEAIVRKNLGTKTEKIIYTTAGEAGKVKTVDVDPAEQIVYCIDDKDITALAALAVKIEKHYQRPMDIEWAKDGIDGEIYILQARPETVKSRSSNQHIDQYTLLEKSTVLTEGRSIGQRIGQGRVRRIDNPADMHKMQAGEVLVTEMTDPDWEPIMKIAAGIITNRGGRTCHAAIIARELGIPAIVGCGNATEVMQDGDNVTLSCIEGETGYVYQGLLPYKHDSIEINKMPALPFDIYLNLGNPDKAFSYSSLPCGGVGLARFEFIISHMIGIHPEAILRFDELSSDLQQKIKEKTAAYESPREYYIERLKEGIATIAAAFAPKMVIFRLSDFKSNEYANLIGGDLFEPDEENPMLGFRGASRYIADNFAPCFELECIAIKRVREQMGLRNAQVMVPFVRTVKEAEQAIATMKQFGLTRGENGLKVFMMCEIPSNALLAESFLPHFDGFSIGSNDLTQLTLGLDRDSSLVAHIFDERDQAVKVLLQQAISACNKAGKYVGICGQGPSDHPDLALWLMEQGIQSVSLTPDSVISTWLYLADHKNAS